MVKTALFGPGKHWQRTVHPKVRDIAGGLQAGLVVVIGSAAVSCTFGLSVTTWDGFITPNWE